MRFHNLALTSFAMFLNKQISAAPQRGLRRGLQDLAPYCEFDISIYGWRLVLYPGGFDYGLPSPYDVVPDNPAFEFDGDCNQIPKRVDGCDVMLGPAMATVVLGEGYDETYDINDTFFLKDEATSGYKSGETSFDLYVANHFAFPDKGWESKHDSVTVQYTLDGVYEISAIAFWHFAGLKKTIYVLVSTDAGDDPPNEVFDLVNDFPQPTYIADLDDDPYGHYMVEKLSLPSPRHAKHIRFEMMDCKTFEGGPGTCALGEIAFRTCGAAT